METFKIDQDALCTYCEKSEIAHRNSCEGSRCAQATEDYSADHDLISEGGTNTFGDVDEADKLYALVDNHMLKIEVSAIIKKGGLVTFEFDGTGVDKISVKPHRNSTESEGVYLYINKDTALEKYKMQMSDTIIHMAETIAHFK